MVAVTRFDTMWFSADTFQTIEFVSMTTNRSNPLCSKYRYNVVKRIIIWLRLDLYGADIRLGRFHYLPCAYLIYSV